MSGSATFESDSQRKKNVLFLRFVCGLAGYGRTFLEWWVGIQNKNFAGSETIGTPIECILSFQAIVVMTSRWSIAMPFLGVPATQSQSTRKKPLECRETAGIAILTAV